MWPWDLHRKNSVCTKSSVVVTTPSLDFNLHALNCIFFFWINSFWWWNTRWYSFPVDNPNRNPVLHLSHFQTYCSHHLSLISVEATPSFNGSGYKPGVQLDPLFLSHPMSHLSKHPQNLATSHYHHSHLLARPCQSSSVLNYCRSLLIALPVPSLFPWVSSSQSSLCDPGKLVRSCSSSTRYLSVTSSQSGKKPESL